MIRQLSARCWYVNGDWEDYAPAHFPSQAGARRCAAELAAEEDRPPPVPRRTGGACWIAQCARCTRPLGDRDEHVELLHCTSRAELRTELDTAGWRLVVGRWCCPGCATAHPPLDEVTWVRVSVHRGDTHREVLGEATACPQLAVTTPPRAALDADPAARWWAGVGLTHLPTGRSLPTQLWADDVGTLHRLARLLTHLDWTSPDPADYATGYAAPLLDALDQANHEQLSAAAEGGEPR